MMLKLTITIVTGILLSGCIALPIPHENWDTPKLRGNVFDAETKNPVAGVSVRLVDYPSQETITNENGYFELEPIKNRKIWLVYPLVAVDAVCGTNIEFSRTGYATKIKYVGDWTSAAWGCTDVQYGTGIHLEKEMSNSAN